MSSTPYSSVEEDYSAGALTDEIYDFTNVSGASYYAYQVEDNASGVAQQEILDNNDGSHTIIGLGAADQTFTSIADDTFTGGGANETFVFTPIFGSDTITDFYQYTSGATHDTISLVNVGIRQLRGGDGSGDECRKQCGHQGRRRRYADARQPQHDDARRPFGGLHVPCVSGLKFGGSSAIARQWVNHFLFQ